MTVQSVRRAFTLLRALSVGPAGVTELAERAELPKSTVARLLTALEAEGAVAQDHQGEDYRLGDGLLDLAGAAQPGRNLVATARPHLLALTARTGETAGISIPDERDMFYLDHADSETDVQVRDWTGERCPIHRVASGLAVMAHWPEHRLEEFLATAPGDDSPWAVPDPDALRERLARVRSLGYAWIYADYAEDINAVAAPIFEPDGTVESAVHIHGPAYRFPDPEQRHDLGVLVVEAAASISAHLTDG